MNFRIVKLQSDKVCREREEVYDGDTLLGVILDLSKHNDIEGDKFEFLSRRYGMKPDTDSDYEKLVERIKLNAQNISDSKTVWMVCKTGDKYYDGFYGADAFIHSEHQIFNQNEMPYIIDCEYINIVVGVGEKPTPTFVRELLIKQN